MSVPPPRAASPLKGIARARWAGPGSLLAWIPAILVLLPVATVFWRLLGPADDAWHHVAATLLWPYVWQTALLVALVAGLALLCGVPTAWWVATCQFPGRGFLKWALVLPLAVPGYVAALAFNDLATLAVPLFVRIREAFGVEAFFAAQQVFRWLLAVIVLGSTLYPYVYLTSLACFTRQTAGCIEAARTLGVPARRVFWRVALPMARPAIAAGAALAAFETLNDYGVVHFFGLNTLTVGIFRTWQSEGALNTAIRLAGLLLLIAVASLVIERWQRGRRHFEAGNAEAPLALRHLSRWRALGALLACALPFLVGFLVPASRLVRWAWHSLSGAPPWADILRAAGHSFGLAAGSALLIMLGALVVVASHRAYRSPSLAWARQLGSLGYTFPSALVAVGVGALLSRAAESPGLGWLALSATVTGLMFAYFVRFLAVGIQPVDAGFRQVSGEFHEAARTLGSRPWEAIRRVDLPLAWPALLAGGTLAFVDVFKELTLTLVLRPFDFETLATQVVRLTDEGRVPDAAFPALLLVAFSLAGLIPLTHLSARRQ